MLVNRKKEIVMLVFLNIFIILMIPTFANAEVNEKYLEEVINKKIIVPYADGDYRLDKNVTRAEYLTALYKAVCVIDSYGIMNDREIEEQRTTLINDIKKLSIEDFTYKDLNQHWSKNLVNWIKNYIDERKPGYFKEIFPGDQFNPEEFITKEEIVAVTISFSTSPINVDKEKYIKLEDLDESNRFYNENIYLLENKILTPIEENSFGINKFITRNDLAIIMNNLMKDMSYRKNFFIYSDIKENKNIFSKPLLKAINMYNEGQENRQTYEYLLNEYKKNKDMLSKKENEYYIWALKTLILCGL